MIINPISDNLSQVAWGFAWLTLDVPRSWPLGNSRFTIELDLIWQNCAAT